MWHQKCQSSAISAQDFGIIIDHCDLKVSRHVHGSLKTKHAVKYCIYLDKLVTSAIYIIHVRCIICLDWGQIILKSNSTCSYYDNAWHLICSEFPPTNNHVEAPFPHRYWKTLRNTHVSNTNSTADTGDPGFEATTGPAVVWAHWTYRCYGISWLDLRSISKASLIGPLHR